MYWRILMELAMNRFKWKGFPEGQIDTRYLELILHEQALAVFFFDDRYNKYFALQGTGQGAINMYHNPTRFTVVGTGNFQGKTFNAKECVPIWANALRVPDHDIIYTYAKRLATFDTTIETNLISQRHTVMIFAEESQRLSWTNIMRQHIEGQPVILGTTGLDMNNIQVFPIATDKDLVLNTLIAKSKVWNECMTLLGVNNANQEKRERLVSDEVAANDDQVRRTRSSALRARQEAAEQINRLYPELNVSVEWDGEVDVRAQSIGESITSGGGE